MKKYIAITILIPILLGIFSLNSLVNNSESKEVFIPASDEYVTILKKDIFSLMMAYPEYIVDIEVKENNNIYLILKSGEKLLYDDRKEKNYLEKLANPDLQDMMTQNYILGSIDKLMPEDYNPGRVRVYPLLKEV